MADGSWRVLPLGGKHEATGCAACAQARAAIAEATIIYRLGQALIDARDAERDCYRAVGEALKAAFADCYRIVLTTPEEIDDEPETFDDDGEGIEEAA